MSPIEDRSRRNLFVCGYLVLLLLLLCTDVSAQTAQQKCDAHRIDGWRKFAACEAKVLSKLTKGIFFDHEARLAKCRHSYFKTWHRFQALAGLRDTTCSGARFVDNATEGTVTDRLTTLVWEKKKLDSGVHNVNVDYSITMGPPYREDGTAYTVFLRTLNDQSFAGSSGWRVPTLIELQTLVMDYPCAGSSALPKCRCTEYPCIDPVFGVSSDSSHWTSTANVSFPDTGWSVEFYFGHVSTYSKSLFLATRAVLGGL